MTTQRTQRRVVCAALKKGAVIICGPRHFDTTMHEQIARVGINMRDAKQGFIDQWGKFMDRVEALEVAKASNQILVKTHPEYELFSEDLY